MKKVKLFSTLHKRWLSIEKYVAYITLLSIFIPPIFFGISKKIGTDSFFCIGIGLTFLLIAFWFLFPIFRNEDKVKSIIGKEENEPYMGY